MSRMADGTRARLERAGAALLGDHRRLAVVTARLRVGAGVAFLLTAGPLARVTLGSTSREARAAMRLTGARDLALGLGALTTVKERTQDAEWVSMGALVDGLDAVVLLGTRRLPLRARLIGVIAAITAVTGLWVSQRLADERTDPDRSA
jgi:hypothetical protein